MSRPVRRFRHARKLTAAAVVVAIIAAPGMASGGEPKSDDTAFEVDGLKRPVHISVDEWGISHIRASNTDDLFYAQGFSAAKDRLFQIDTWRRSGLGELSKVLGSEYVEQDTASRLFLYRGDMEKEWESYPSETRAAAVEYAQGINAYVDWLQANPDKMPPEFKKLGYEPARWKAEDVVRIRTHAIGESARFEHARAQLACAGGIEASKFLRKLEPDHEPKIPAGLDPCSVPDDVLATYQLASAEVVFEDGKLKTADPETAGIREAASGSNVWALAPERTKSGRPILASDPHRTSNTAPANRHLVHLKAPGIDVIGAGEPWNPGVSFGHNGNISFGLTNMPIDQTDLYVYELDENDPTRYRYKDGWEKFKTVKEEIPVADGDNATADLQYTRHGPVLQVDKENNRAFAIRTVWSEPGTSPYLGSLGFQKAKNFEEFKQDLDKWKTPGSNLAYADTKGNIGWAPVGLVPRRVGKDFDGLLPVPGDGRYEWDGFHSQDEMPTIYNPDEKYYANANNRSFPEGHPVKPTYEWHLPFRGDRLDEVLSKEKDSTLEDALKLQTDHKSLFATQLVPYLKSLKSDDPKTKKALEILRDYDGVASKDSAGAALFETWASGYLQPSWIGTLFPEGAQNPIFYFNPEVTILLDSFADPDEWFGADGAKARDKIILESLVPAFEAVEEKLGSDTGEWRWGDLQTQTFTHPLGDTFGPVPRGGSYHTLQASMYIPGSFEQVVGPVFRMAVDVGDWDASRAINAPGQSGDPSSPHYDDLHELWAKDGTFPLVYSSQAIKKHTESKIIMRPRRG